MKGFPPAAVNEFLTHAPLFGLPGLDLCDEVWPVDVADPITFEPVDVDPAPFVDVGADDTHAAATANWFSAAALTCLPSRASPPHRRTADRLTEASTDRLMRM